jgi:NTE family protein
MRAGYLHEVFQLSPFLGKGVYLLSLYEAGKAYGVSSATRLPNDVAGGVLVQSALGPLFVGGSVGDAGHRKWFFQLGHLF